MQNIDERILEMLHEVGGVIVNDHIDHGREMHGDSYIQAEKLFPHPEQMDFISSEMAKLFIQDGVEIVVGVLNDETPISTMVALHLTRLTGREVLSIHAHKPPETEFFRFRMHQRSLIKNKKALLVKGVLVNGFSTNKLASSVSMAGGTVVGLGAVCNIGGVASKDVGNIKSVLSLVNIKTKRWHSSVCPLCKTNVPVNMNVGMGYATQKQAPR